MHRDLKPENILFDFSGLYEMKIIDFELATSFLYNKKQKNQIGTLHYIAPEVLQKRYDEKCDLWSIGVMTY